jgi:hypothetical protein
MPDLTKMLPLLVSMRAMCDALLLEIAEEQKPRVKKGLGLRDTELVECDHDLWPGMGPTGTCKVCGETVAREVKDG